MTEPASHTLAYLRRLDEKLDRLHREFGERFDRIEGRLEEHDVFEECDRGERAAFNQWPQRRASVQGTPRPRDPAAPGWRARRQLADAASRARQVKEPRVASRQD